MRCDKSCCHYPCTRKECGQGECDQYKSIITEAQEVIDQASNLHNNPKNDII